MGPQCEDGYTKIANELLEALCRIRIPGESMQIFLVILRKTYGYGKKIDRISLNQFVEATGLKKPNVCRAIKQLQSMNVIHSDRIVTDHDSVGYVTYRINKLYETWDKVEKKHNVKPLSTSIKVFIKSDNGPLSETITPVIKSDNETLSETITNVIKSDTHNRKKERKETDTKENLLPICQAWKAYVQMRVKMKKPLTTRAMELAVTKLLHLQSIGHDPVDVLDQSVFYSWQGLFEVKDPNVRGKPEPAPPAADRITTIMKGVK